VSYEYLYPKPERLRDKPFRADELMEKVVEAGFKPTTLRVDNDRGSVVIYFTGELDKKAKKALDELISDIFKGW
jgi:hypothetical protein